MPQPIPITMVRHTDDEARSLLEGFVFGGSYSGGRVPRGINPEFVSQFLRERLKAESSASAYERALEVVRFYERPDTLAQFRLALTGREANPNDVRRSDFALQAFGDLAPPDQVGQAADYFQRVLLNKPAMLDAVPATLDTMVTLVPAASPDAVFHPLHAAANAASQQQSQSEQAMMRYDKLASYLRNDFDKARIAAEGRRRLQAMGPDQRRPQLVAIYLGQSPVSNALMEVWAARLLRAEAMQGNPAPVYAEFSRAIDAATPDRLGQKRADFIVQRAAQAIIYLQGTLTPAQREAYSRSKEYSANFLWDDIEALAPPRKNG